MVYYRESFAAFLKPSFPFPQPKSSLQPPLPCISHCAPSQLLLPQPLLKASTHPQHSSLKNMGFPGSATDLFLLLLLFLPGRAQGSRQVWPSSICYSHFWACPAKVWLPAAHRRGTCSSPKQALALIKNNFLLLCLRNLKRPWFQLLQIPQTVHSKVQDRFFPL